MFCVQCGTRNDSSARFCYACGHAMDTSGPIRDSPLAIPIPISRVLDEEPPPFAKGESPQEPSDASSEFVTGGDSSEERPTDGASGHETDAESRPLRAALPYSYSPLEKWSTVVFVLLSVLAVVHASTAERPLGFTMSVPDSIPSKQNEAAVVSVVCESVADQETTRGSGVMMDESGIVLTNSHVIPQDETTLHTRSEGCVVILPDAASHSIGAAFWALPVVHPVLAERYDLAWLKIQALYRDEDGNTYGTYPRKFASLYGGDGGVSYVKMCGNETTVGLGDPVRIYGYPAASGVYTLMVTDGIVSSRLEGGLLATSAKVDSGNSGGLAVDKRGCLVGIPSAVLRGNYENYGVIIPTQLINEFAAKLQEPTK